jgi:hypothetical protein
MKADKDQDKRGRGPKETSTRPAGDKIEMSEVQRRNKEVSLIRLDQERS